MLRWWEYYIQEKKIGSSAASPINSQSVVEGTQVDLEKGLTEVISKDTIHPEAII